MRSLILLLVSTVGWALFAFGQPAFADSPVWGKEPLSLLVHSTRAIIKMDLKGGGLNTKWKAEYAPTEHAPTECGGSTPAGKWPESPWQLADEKETSGGDNQVFIGSQDPGDGATAPIEVRRLAPNTCYVARFVAWNADGEAKENVFFPTLPVEKPEVPKSGLAEENHCPIFEVLEVTDKVVRVAAKVESNGAGTKYSFEYALPEGGHRPSPASTAWKPFSSGSGEVTAGADFGNVSGSTTGLSAETTYYIRIGMTNEKGFSEQSPCGSETVTTGTEKPAASIVVRNVVGSSAHLSGEVFPRGVETRWRFESAVARSGGMCPSVSEPGAWTPVPGGSGAISTGQAEATPYPALVNVGVDIGGLARSSLYCVRLTVSNAAGGAESEDALFETEGRPSAVRTFMVHQLIGDALKLFGTVDPKVMPTSEEQSIVVSGATGGTFTLSFAGNTTKPIAYDAPATSTSGSGSVESALKALGLPVQVEGVDGGPYTVFFGGSDEGLVESPIEANGLALAPTGAEVNVTEVQKGGESFDTQFWFQYTTQKRFEESGWSGAEETARSPAGVGKEARVVGLEVQGVKGGETYRFRLLAENGLSEGSPTTGDDRTLTMPAASAIEGGGGCSNETLRTGLSGRLSDCRAYEQLTPLEKGAAQEPFHYRFGINSAVVVGEDGEHAVLEAPEVIYGSGTGSGQSPYLFSREGMEEGAGRWAMTAGAPQPETGIDSATPQVYSANLTKMAFESAYAPSRLSKSSEVEYKVGPVGGAYRTAVSVPRQDVEELGAGHPAVGWVAGDGDLSKLVLATVDHELLGSATGTREGSDLYEYTSGGGLSQLNVTSEGATIGSCGARMADGEEGANPAAVNSKANRAEDSDHPGSSSHSVSTDGSRVFFEAVPGGSCSEAKHLYMRVNGSETVDVGAYRFLAADANGIRLVLVKPGTGGEVVGYDTETRTLESQPEGEFAEEQELTSLGIPARFALTAGDAFARPRYTFWTPPIGIEGQAFRYDSGEHVFECVSCASPSDSEPQNPAYLGDSEGLPHAVNGGLPDFAASSRNGDFAFFTTVSRLLPLDEDGEFRSEPSGGEFVPASGHASQSTDVYEWRAAGVDGCGALQGCLSLITDGSGGYLNLFLGTAAEGRDVFFYTRSVLTATGHGSEGSIGEGNVYDARIDGGTPRPPAQPVGCEPGQCATPPNPPVDLTPASFTFAGSGNVVDEQRAPKPKKRHKKKHIKRKKKRRAKRKHKGGNRRGMTVR